MARREAKANLTMTRAKGAAMTMIKRDLGSGRTDSIVARPAQQRLSHDHDSAPPLALSGARPGPERWFQSFLLAGIRRRLPRRSAAGAASGPGGPVAAAGRGTQREPYGKYTVYSESLF